jgi:uncharacterized protein (TIGR02001 family)
MTRLKWLIAAGLVVTTGAAQAAGLSSTWTITTDYDFRGITQTAHDAALQGSVDYAWANGFSVGAWVSNINFDDCCDEKVELDLYGGYSKSFDNGFGFTVNGVYYTYPGASYGDGLPNLSFWEVNVGASYKAFNIKYWYSGDFGHFEDVFKAATAGAVDSAKAWYLEANYSFALPKDITLALHAGMSGGDYWDNIGVVGEGPSAEYEDYSVAFSKAFGDFTVTAKYIYPQVDDAYKIHEGAFSNNARAMISVATTFQ